MTDIKRRNEGMILIAALWIMAILSLFAAGVGFRASLEARLSKYNMDKLKARYLAWAGVVKASDRLSKDTNSGWDGVYECGISLVGAETPEGVFGAGSNKLGAGAFSVYYTQRRDSGDGEDIYYGLVDEEKKININMNKLAPGNAAEFRRILKGLSSDITDEVASAVIDWQDGGDFDSATSPGGAEDFFYETEYGYSSKDAPFETVEEFCLVKGVTPELFDEVRDYITVYGDGKININTASKKVLTAVIDDGKRTYLPLIEGIVSFRNGADQKAGTADDQAFIDAEQVKSVVRQDDIQGKARLDQLMPYFTVQSGNFIAVSHGKVNAVTQEVRRLVKREKDTGKKTAGYYHEE